MTVVFRRYSCSDCRTERVTQDTEAIPLCPTCRGPMTFRKATWAKSEYLNLGTGMRAPALDFNQTRGRVAPIGDGIEVNSLHDIRRIERESEKMERDGVGEAYVFRKYSQDASNVHVHTMGESPQKAPSKAWMDKHGHTLRPTDENTAVETGMGPGAREELASYLPDKP